MAGTPASGCRRDGGIAVARGLANADGAHRGPGLAPIAHVGRFAPRAAHGIGPGSDRPLSRNAAPPPTGKRVQRLLRTALRSAAGVAGPAEPRCAEPPRVLW